MKKAIATPPGKPTKRVNLSDAEAAQRKAEASSWKKTGRTDQARQAKRREIKQQAGEELLEALLVDDAAWQDSVRQKYAQRLGEIERGNGDEVSAIRWQP